jgi:hypothetical protein
MFVETKNYEGHRCPLDLRDIPIKRNISNPSDLDSMRRDCMEEIL